MKLKSGLTLIDEDVGTGDLLERQKTYRIALRCWLNRGEPIRWRQAWGLIDTAELRDDGALLISDLRIDRENLIAGLFYGVEGMRIGGSRKLKISPQLAYGEQGVPGVVPGNALLICEISILEERQGV